MSDNLLLSIAERVDGRPGRPISLNHSQDLPLAAFIGAVDAEDVLWAVGNLDEQKLIKGSWLNYFTNGHLTAATIIEDEIRRCRFLVADLTDANAGAYWEAGLAEGLGKPVIYICRSGVQTHFDTDHRHTVRWDLANFDETAKHLKAVIRNTLLGDANQED